MKRFRQKSRDWIEDRTGLVSLVDRFLSEDTPASTGWRHVFGSVTLFLFMLQGLTGFLLLFNYAPMPGDSYQSLKYITTQLSGGRIIQGLHHWGASITIIVVGLHLVQTAVYGAYKKPREVTWIVGIMLLVLILVFGLTGYLLPWDNRAYWSTVVATEIASLAPGGESVVRRLLGVEAGVIGVTTFTRFYGLHVNVLPAITAVAIVLHVYLVRRHGVTPAANDKGPKIAFYPTQVLRDTISIFAVFTILFIMAVFVEAPLGKLADPTDKAYVPRPEWYFLFLFQLLKLFQGSWEIFGAIVLPALAILGLILVPFIDRREMRSIRDRTIAVSVVGLCIGGWASLTLTALMTAPNGTVGSATEWRMPVHPEWAEFSPAELAGLAYFREDNCAKCHSLITGGPKIGPTLATIRNGSMAGMLAHLKRLATDKTGDPLSGESSRDLQKGSALMALMRALTPDRGRVLDSIPDGIVQGARIYQRSQCHNCHQINGQGVAVGPDLDGIGARRTVEWVKNKIQDPKAAPDTMMPPFELVSEDLDQIARYLVRIP